MRVLSIGNSFSQDAHRWLFDIADAVGEDLTCANLYIGGCSLQRHWDNLQQDAVAYAYEENGRDTGRKTSIRRVLQEGGWDVVTLQQVSHESGLYETYQPYLSDLADYVRRAAPGAGLWLHQTWAYDAASTHPGFAKYGNDQKTMYTALCNAYEKAGRAIGASIIPSGDVIQVLRTQEPFDTDMGGISLCRDGFHMSRTYGRYAVACAWVMALTGASLEFCDFLPEEEGELPVDPDLLALIRETVESLLG